MNCPECNRYYNSSQSLDVHRQVSHRVETTPRTVVEHRVVVQNSPKKSDNDAFITSAVVGAVTDSTILGALVGGSVLGAVAGDLLDSDLFD